MADGKALNAITTPEIGEQAAFLFEQMMTVPSVIRVLQDRGLQDRRIQDNAPDWAVEMQNSLNNLGRRMEVHMGRMEAQNARMEAQDARMRCFKAHMEAFYTNTTAIIDAVTKLSRTVNTQFDSFTIRLANSDA